MPKPIIAIDIDEVLGEYAVEFVKFSNARWGTNLSVEDYSENWSEMWQIDHRETMERSKIIYTKGVGFYGDLKKLVGADEAMQTLKETYDLVLVTSRPLSVEQETRDWLEQHYSNLVSAIYFAGMYDGDITDKSFLKTKANVFSEIKPTFIIDDLPKHCHAAADMGIRAILFGEYPWNKDTEETDRIKRCRNWSEVVDFITAH